MDTNVDFLFLTETLIPHLLISSSNHDDIKVSSNEGFLQKEKTIIIEEATYIFICFKFSFGSFKFRCSKRYFIYKIIIEFCFLFSKE